MKSSRSPDIYASTSKSLADKPAALAQLAHRKTEFESVKYHPVAADTAIKNTYILPLSVKRK